MKTAKTSIRLSKFDNQTRFNWGFHDAVQVVREGWQSKNFGFGPAIQINDPEEILTKHYDKIYARGWLSGYYEALGGVSTCESSEGAWKAHLKHIASL